MKHIYLKDLLVNFLVIIRSSISIRALHTKALFAFFILSILINTSPGYGQIANTATHVYGQDDFYSKVYDATDSIFASPTNIAIDPSTGKVFVTDPNANRVMRYASVSIFFTGGKAEAVLGQPDFLTTSYDVNPSATNMRNPRGIDIDSNGTLFVADYYNRRVLRFDNASSKSTGAAADGVLGQSNLTTNSIGISQTRMDYVSDVKIHPNGTLFVMGWSARRVLLYNNAASLSNGAPADVVLGNPNFNENISSTCSASNIASGGYLELMGDTLYVTQFSCHRVLIWDNVFSKSNGAAADRVLGQTNFTSSSTTLNQRAIYHGNGISKDASGNLYISDSYHDRILFFSNAKSLANGALADAVIGQTDYVTNGAGLSPTQLDYPAGMRLVQHDGTSYMLIIDNGNKRMLFFPQFYASIAANNISCNGLGDGSANLTVGGGTSPYSYAWSNAATTEDLTNLSSGSYTVTVTDKLSNKTTADITITQPALLTGSIAKTDVSCGGDAEADYSPAGGTTPYTYYWSTGQSIQDLTNINAGTYSVTVTDKNACTDSSTTTITAPPGLLSTSIAKTDPGTACSANGSVNLTVSGGSMPYTFAWSNGATTEDLGSLSTGTYTVTVTDDVSCTIIDMVSIRSTIPALSLSISATDLACNGGTDGSVDLSVSGGSTPYSFAWSNAANTQNLANLVIGTYSVTVTDSSGCTETISTTVSEPAALNLVLTPTNVSSFAGSDGAIDLIPSGGTTPYSYNWSNSASTQDLSGLVACSFKVTVSDLNGCSAIDSVDITQPAAAPQVLYSEDFETYSNGTTTGSGSPANWTIDISATTSVDRFQVESNAIKAKKVNGEGVFLSKVIDISGYEADISIAIIENKTVETGDYIRLYYKLDGGAETLFETNGDMTDLEFTSATATHSGLKGSTLQIIIRINDPNKDYYGFDDIVVNGSPVQNPNLNISKSDVTCSGNDGAINLSVCGGLEPFTYNWSNAATTEDLTALGAGTYTITVTDDNGSIDSATVTINAPVCAGCVATGSGFWTTTASWSGNCNGVGGLPAVSDSVYISSGVSITLNDDIQIKYLDISANGTLNISSNKTLEISGNMLTDGNLNATNGEIEFNGTTEQNISGSVSPAFFDLIVNNSSSTGVILNQSISVNNSINLIDGDLYTGSDTLHLINDDGSAMGNYSENSYVAGMICQRINNSGKKLYEFPVGYGTPEGFHWAKIKSHNLKGTSCLCVKFDSLLNHSDVQLAQSFITPPADWSLYYSNDSTPVVTIVGTDTVTTYPHLPGAKNQLEGGHGADTYIDANDYLKTEYALEKAYQEDGIYYSSMSPEGVWYLEPDKQPRAGYYDLILSTDNLSGLTDNYFGILKRPTGTSGLYWSHGNGKQPKTNETGRKLSDGKMIRKYLTTFSEGGGGGGGDPAPITLMTFTANAKNNAVVLFWQTATELNNDFFSIERSEDAVNFEEIIQTKGAGTTSLFQNYTEVDESPLAGISYYRLKQTDFDGQFSYSDVVAVKMVSDISGLNILPNPNSGVFNLVLQTESKNGLLKIFDSKGQLAYISALSGDGQTLAKHLNLKEILMPGLYYVSLRTGKEEFVRKLNIK